MVLSALAMGQTPKDKPHTLSDEQKLCLLTMATGERLWRFESV